MSAYIRSLNQQIEQPTPQQAPQPPDLRARFLAWHSSLPEVSKHRMFSILEIEQALNTQGRYLSPILLSLGWQRKRKWSTKGQYFRYWESKPKTV